MILIVTCRYSSSMHNTYNIMSFSSRLCFVVLFCHMSSPFGFSPVDVVEWTPDAETFVEIRVVEIVPLRRRKWEKLVATVVGQISYRGPSKPTPGSEKVRIDQSYAYGSWNNMTKKMIQRVRVHGR